MDSKRQFSKTATLAGAALWLAAAGGCAWLSSAPKPEAAATTAGPIVTPNFSLAAKVISVNTVGRFVVLSFPAGGVPKLDQTLFLYRNGLKTAEVRITGPQQENNIVADLTSGDAQVGDTVSDK
jgi:hypothetical protein